MNHLTPISRGLFTLIILVQLLGCATTISQQQTRKQAQDETQVSTQTLQGFGLLYDLMVKEAKVDQIFLVKSTFLETEQLINDIATTARNVKKQIEDADLNVDQTGLPPVELAARSQIKSQQTRTLLFAGDDFELKLLLTQASATEYAAALCAAIKKEADAQHHAWLADAEAQFRQHYQASLARLSERSR